jgi:hypothetical protein
MKVLDSRSNKRHNYSEPPDVAAVPQLRTKLNNRAHQRAMHELRNVHRAEFEHLLEKHRLEIGLHPDHIDLPVALEAFYDVHPRRAPRRGHE